MKKRLVSSNISNTYNLKPMSSESSTELKRIYNGILTLISALEVLKRDVSRWDALLVFYDVKFFNNETRKQWKTYFNSKRDDFKPPKFNFLGKFIEKQISILESIEECIKNKTV